MKIGIFGGSFNPVHNMHIYIGEYLINNNYLDKVIYMPHGTNYKYKNNLIDNKDRYNMLLLATKNNNNLEVSDYELTDEESFTIDTLNYFKNKYKDDEIYFICGYDNLDYIDKWKNGNEILTNYPLIVISRKNYNIDEILTRYKQYNPKIIVSNIEMNDISSTIIRNNIKENKGIKEFVNKDVEEYIINNNLYK